MKHFIQYLLLSCFLISLSSCSTRKNNASIYDNTTSAISQETNQSSPDMVTIPTTQNTVQTLDVIFDTSSTIEETILYDENGLVIIAKKLSFTSLLGKVELQFINNTDKKYTFISSSNGYHCNSVNGFMTPGEGYVYCSVNAGETKYYTANYNLKRLKQWGIIHFSDIELAFDISNDSDQIFTPPLSIKTSLYNEQNIVDNYFNQYIGNGTLESLFESRLVYSAKEDFYNNDGIQIISNTILETQDKEMILLVEAKNTSDNYVNIFLKDISVNNLLIYDYACADTTIAPGKYCILEINITNLIDKPYWDIYRISEIYSINYYVELKDMQYKTTVPKKPISIQLSSDVTVEQTFQELYNEKGIQILFCGIVDEDNEYTNDLRVVLIVNNQTDHNLTVEVANELVLVNGTKLEIPYEYQAIAAGQQASLIFELPDKIMEALGATNPNVISSLEFTLEIENEKYELIARPTITIIIE